MGTKSVIKINLPGGVLATGDLYALMQAATAVGMQDIQTGMRQQLYCTVLQKNKATFTDALDRMKFHYECDADTYPNIISSYAAHDVFNTQHWLSEGLYKDILAQFDYSPSLKISIVDAEQSLVPYNCGHINFISSRTNNHWYLQIRYPGTAALLEWPSLVYSGDIARISKYIEWQISRAGAKHTTIDWLVDAVNKQEPFLPHPVVQGMAVKDFQLSYYEGFHKMDSRNWLGIYRRQELFPVAFLQEMAALCMQSGIGQVYTTPWKSILVKGIAASDYPSWDYLLGKHRINVHHAANELNWQLEDLDEEGLQLKKYLIRQFDKEDIRTQGICFGIRTNSQADINGSVIIRKQENTSRNQYKLMNRYDILYTENFNPNARNYIVFRKDIEKQHLPDYICSLVKYYYESRNNPGFGQHNIYRENFTAKEPAPAENANSIHRCQHCLTTYDPAYGDACNKVAPGTAFEALPATYACPTCNSPLDNFEKWVTTVPVQESTCKEYAPV